MSEIGWQGQELTRFCARLGGMSDPIFSCTVRPASTSVRRFPAPPDQTLLESAEQALEVWPNSCRNGTCRTCIGQLAQGAVRYAIEWPGLSAEEKAQGYVLACVAYPVEDVVLV
jgi:ferredoxin